MPVASSRFGFHVGLTSLALVLLWRWIRRTKIHHPPSPSSLPFIGNLFSIPPGNEYFAFAKLGEQLNSDIVFLDILGHKHVILNSAKAASEMLEKRAALYSDRPPIPMVKDPALMGWSGNAGLIEYNEVWRHYRRMMNNCFNKRAVTRFNDLQERQARLLLRRLLSATSHVQPFECVKSEFFFIAGSTMLQLAYGYEPRDPQDGFFKEAQQTIHNVVSAGMQTNFLVNVFPALLYVPDWFPGTGWKRTGKEYGVQLNKAKSGPYEWTKAQVANGTFQPSLISSLLQDQNLMSGLSSEEKDERLKDIGMTLFGGGTDTSAQFFVCFVAAMVLNPDIQAKAQLELDTILGHGVLPRVSDRERLPYINNLIDEVFRLYPVVPLGLPHACFEDDIFRGYNIQKGTTILGNIWAITRDSRHYPNPEIFDPDRYQDPDVPRPPVFGWGRRKCPGIHFAAGSTFVTVASLLAMLTFSKKKDSSGQEVIPRVELERNSMMLEFKPFDFEFWPRSEEHQQIIMGATTGGE